MVKAEYIDGVLRISFPKLKLEEEITKQIIEVK